VMEVARPNSGAVAKARRQVVVSPVVLRDGLEVETAGPTTHGRGKGWRAIKIPTINIRG